MSRKLKPNPESDFYKQRVAHATKLYEEGKTWTEIARMMNIKSSGTVRNWIVGRPQYKEPETATEHFCKCCTAGIVRFKGEQAAAECDECGQYFQRNMFGHHIPAQPTTGRKASHYTKSEYKALSNGLGNQHTGRRGKTE